MAITFTKSDLNIDETVGVQATPIDGHRCSNLKTA